jgi:cell division protease FtsH
LIAYFQPSSRPLPAVNQVALSSFLADVNAGGVRDVVIQGRAIAGQRTDGSTFTTYSPADANFIVQRLIEKNARVFVKPEETDLNPMIHLLLSWLPWMLWVLTFRLVGVRILTTLDRNTARRFAELERRLRTLEAGSH